MHFNWYDKILYFDLHFDEMCPSMWWLSARQVDPLMKLTAQLLLYEILLQQSPMVEIGSQLSIC